MPPLTSGGTPLASGGPATRARAANKALGRHAALVAADSRLRPGECLAAFLDTVYVVTTRAREAYSMSSRLPSKHGRASLLISARTGCTTVLEGLLPLASVRGGQACRRGAMHLGQLADSSPRTPPSARRRSHRRVRLLEEAAYGVSSPCCPIQHAWLILSMCAAPRADHPLRALPPHLSASYACGHDILYSGSVDDCFVLVLLLGSKRGLRQTV